MADNHYSKYSEIKIGETEATSIDNISKFMQKSKTFDTLDFSDFLTQLNLSNTRNDYVSIKTLGSKVTEVLRRWKSSSPLKATLQNLLIALSNLHCNDTAQCLIDEYETYVQQWNRHEDNESLKLALAESFRDQSEENVNKDNVEEEHASRRANQTEIISENQEQLLPLHSDVSFNTYPKRCTNGYSKGEALNKKSKKNVTLLLITILVLSLAFLSFLAFIFVSKYKGYDVKENLSSTPPDTKSNNTFTAHFNHSSFKPIIIKSCNEHTQLLGITPISESLSLVIPHNADFVWETYENISDLHCIKNVTIKGSLSEGFISKILESATSLHELNFESWFDRNCTSLETNNKPLLQMSSVRVLTITNYSTCHDTYLRLIRSHQMFNIQDLRIIGGVIDNEFIRIFQEILKLLTSLLRLEISATISTLNPIFLDTGSSSVQELCLNLRYLHEEAIQYSLQKTEHYFCKVFSHLNLLNSKRVDIPLKILLQCKNLQIISTKFFISGNDTIPDVSLLKKEINSLTNITLDIKFDRACPPLFLLCMDDMGIKYLAQSVKYLTIKSNCQITKNVYTYSSSANDESFPC